MSVEFLKKEEDEYLTDLEVISLIKNLSQPDIFKLGQIAKQYTYYCLMDADELLNEVIILTASGKRKFPRHVSLIAFFARTMKSIASNEIRKLNKKVTPIDDEPDNDPIVNIVADNIYIEDEIATNQQIKNIYDLFKNDEDVTMLLMAKYDGLSPDETCETTGWNRTKYDSVQKRLRRSLNKHFPNGRET